MHLKHQALFTSKDKRKKLKCRLLQFLALKGLSSNIRAMAYEGLQAVMSKY